MDVYAAHSDLVRKAQAQVAYYHTRDAVFIALQGGDLDGAIQAFNDGAALLHHWGALTRLAADGTL